MIDDSYTHMSKKKKKSKKSKKKKEREKEREKKEGKEKKHSKGSGEALGRVHLSPGGFKVTVTPPSP